ncbi:MAG: acetyl-CoA carboxylase biotin carboxyl carrier protein, partial [Firmicutes bacterium]|nr:acetyl-CoA carboxylase biotin carboxyl carrier protein [Bacillota bacterium]
VMGLFEKSDLNKMEITEGGFTLKLEKSGAQTPAYIQAVPLPAQLSPAEVAAFNSGAATVETSVQSGGKEIKSPMVGVFYTAPSPDAQPFVKAGSQVKKGDVLCVIEAMKVMNEITSAYDGEILEICADNGSLVEFSQVLFKIG